MNVTCDTDGLSYGNVMEPFPVRNSVIPKESMSNCPIGIDGATKDSKQE